MIFLLFGGGVRYREHGQGAMRTCSRCYNTATWARMRRFSEFTVFWIPVMRWGRRELEVCPICRNSVIVPSPARRGLRRQSAVAPAAG